MNPIGLFILLFLSTGALAEPPRRIITLGGNVSETVCALGACDSIVATDSSSIFPERLSKLPQLGYARALHAEGLIAQKAELILASTSAGPESVLEKLTRSGIKIAKVDGASTVSAAQARIIALGGILDKKAEADTLLKQMDRDLLTLEQRRLEIGTPQKVLFIYARGSRVLQLAGDKTAAAAMIELAGARNALTGFTEYKGLTPEAVVAAAPDLILMTEDGLQSVGGREGVWKLPGLSMTPAFSTRRLVVMNDLFLLGMGPRLGQAAGFLMDAIYSSDRAITPLSRK